MKQDILFFKLIDTFIKFTLKSEDYISQPLRGLQNVIFDKQGCQSS